MNGRRVFTEVSAALRKACSEKFSEDERTGWLEACRAVCEVFAKMNTAFDGKRFMADCQCPPASAYLRLDTPAMVIIHAQKFGRETTQALLNCIAGPQTIRDNHPYAGAPRNAVFADIKNPRMLELLRERLISDLAREGS